MSNVFDLTAATEKRNPLKVCGKHIVIKGNVVLDIPFAFLAQAVSVHSEATEFPCGRLTIWEVSNAGQRHILFILVVGFCVRESVKSHNRQMDCETFPATPDPQQTSFTPPNSLISIPFSFTLSRLAILKTSQPFILTIHPIHFNQSFNNGSPAVVQAEWWNG